MVLRKQGRSLLLLLSLQQIKGHLLHNTKEEKLKICPEENSKVDWLSPDEAVRSSTEAWMKPIYKKLNQKMRKYLG